MSLKSKKHFEWLILGLAIVLVTILILSDPIFANNPDNSKLCKEIKLKAQTLKLDETRTTIGEKDGKRVKIIPANLDHVKTVEDLERGQIIGVVENEIEGDETGLPKGSHMVYVKKVDGQLKAFAECSGKITVEAASVKIEEKEKSKIKNHKPIFNPEGWCASIHMKLIVEREWVDVYMIVCW